MHNVVVTLRQDYRVRLLIGPPGALMIKAPSAMQKGSAGAPKPFVPCQSGDGSSDIEKRTSTRLSTHSNGSGNFQELIDLLT